jgi:hypothetical protein
VGAACSTLPISGIMRRLDPDTPQTSSMKIGTALANALLVASASAFAASQPDYLFVNRSYETLIDDATATGLFNEIVSAKLARLYPAAKWGFAAQLEGGITQANTCVVAARVMLLPRNQPSVTKLLLFKPGKMATAFDALPNASAEQCKDLAKRKLREENQAMIAALVPD